MLLLLIILKKWWGYYYYAVGLIYNYLVGYSVLFLAISSSESIPF